MTLYLNDMGVVGPLGAGKDEVLANLLARDGSGMAPFDGLLTGRKTVVGRARAELGALPPELAELDCRNNRLLARALDQIRAPVAELRDTFGPAGVAVVLGTSTSGIAAGEEAAAALARDGSMPSHYHYRQQEIGTTAEFAARYLGADGLALHDLDGLLVIGESVRVGGAPHRCRPLRGGGRRRCRQPVSADVERVRCARVAGAGSLQSVQRQSPRHQHRRRRVRIRRLAHAERDQAVRRRRVVRRLSHLGAGPERPRSGNRDPRSARASRCCAGSTSAT